ncbi:MAG: ABC transporter ATP-binding protein [Chloroflexota bacterium]|nr:ABC transporter ATP-binding protein [Chloroflexota bacterium]
MGALVEARDLRKSFGAVPAVGGVSLAVRAGEAYGLVGPDGAGKTTTLRLLVGALSADAGTIEVAGHDIARRTEQARSHIGYLAQRFSLYADLTVAENLRFFGEARGVTGVRFERRAEQLLNFVGLTGFEGRRAEHLSGGMKQKLGLACALVHEPPVLLLDEPTAGVDPVTRQDFWQLLTRVVQEGAAVIVSTPYMDEATRCTRIGFMHTGRILVEGTPRELVGALADRVLELAAQPKDRARRTAQADPEVEDVLAFGDRFHLRVKDAAGPLRRLPASLAAAGVEVSRLRSVAPSVEDVFIWLLSEHRA